MLVRLLIAVLMLTGSLPVRQCTCASAAHAIPDEYSSAVPKSQSGKCECHRETTADEARDHDQEKASLPQPCQHHHEQNCPAAYPRVVPPAIPSPAVELSTDLDFAEPFWIASEGEARPFEANWSKSPQPLRSVPLYIVHLTLRN